MDENNSLNEFMEAFDDSADYQTGSDDSAEVEDSVSDMVTEPDEESEDTSSTEDAAEDASQTDGEKPDAKGESNEETFTLKVNKEEKAYSREEVITLAQKGADYDRVKDQLSQSRQENTTLQNQIAEQQVAMEVLTELAKDAGTDFPGLLKNLRIGMLKKQGLSDDAANERLLRQAVEKENASLKAAAEKQESGADRAKREIEEFRDAYPDVDLTKEVLDKLMDDVQGGTPLLKAYQKYESAQKDAMIADLQRQLAAEKQNKANAAASPGSQKDSGGKHSKGDFDSFMEAFN